jgi:hypothetical protein
VGYDDESTTRPRAPRACFSPRGRARLGSFASLPAALALTPASRAAPAAPVAPLSQVRQSTDNHAVASLLLSRFTFLRRPGLHVVHVASEMVPVAKVGGLGDVVTGLAKAHQQR